MDSLDWLLLKMYTMNDEALYLLVSVFVLSLAAAILVVRRASKERVVR